MSYAESHPKHCRTSCSDTDRCNVDPDGTGCHRCTALELDELSTLRAENERLCKTLESIANAKPSKWEPEMRDQFQPWAQNIARHAIDQARTKE